MKSIVLKFKNFGVLEGSEEIRVITSSVERLLLAYNEAMPGSYREETMRAITFLDRKKCLVEKKVTESKESSAYLIIDLGFKK